MRNATNAPTRVKKGPVAVLTAGDRWRLPGVHVPPTPI